MGEFCNYMVVRGGDCLIGVLFESNLEFISKARSKMVEVTNSIMGR